MTGDREARRAAVVAVVARHLLGTGLRGASLRPMAAAAGTSDRMLLYYFKDRDDLLTAALGEIAGRLLPVLDEAVDLQPRPMEELLAQVLGVVARPEVRAFMQLWLEMAAAAGRGEQPYLAVAGRIADGFLGWIEARLEGEPGPGRAATALRVLAMVEGVAVLEAVGMGEVAGVMTRMRGLGLGTAVG